MSEKITFKSSKEMVDGVAYPAKGTGARHVWDAADEAAETGNNSTDLVAHIVETTDMSKGTVSSQLTYWRKATGKVLAKKVDESAAQRAEEKAEAKRLRDEAKAQREADRQAKKDEREAAKQAREEAKALKAQERAAKDEEKLRKLQERVAAAKKQQTEDSGTSQYGEDGDSEE